MPYKHKRTLPRKRIRGLRRLWRKHQQWATPQALSLDLMESVHINTEQLGIAPWTVHGKPPLAIRQLWANRLLADFLIGSGSLRRYIQASGYPFGCMTLGLAYRS
jgi:hypothetical protein